MNYCDYDVRINTNEEFTKPLTQKELQEFSDFLQKTVPKEGWLNYIASEIEDPNRCNDLYFYTIFNVKCSRNEGSRSFRTGEYFDVGYINLARVYTDVAKRKIDLWDGVTALEDALMENGYIPRSYGEIHATGDIKHNKLHNLLEIGVPNIETGFTIDTDCILEELAEYLKKKTNLETKVILE